MVNLNSFASAREKTLRFNNNNTICENQTLVSQAHTTYTLSNSLFFLAQYFFYHYFDGLKIWRKTIVEYPAQQQFMS